MKSPYSNVPESNRKYLEYSENLHHSIRNSISMIIGYNELLLTEEYGPLNESQRDFLEKIRTHLSSAYESLQTYRSLNCMMAGLYNLTQESVDLVSVFKRVVKSEEQQYSLQFVVNEAKNIPLARAPEMVVLEIVYGIIYFWGSRSSSDDQISISIALEGDFIKSTLTTTGIKTSSKNKFGKSNQINLIQLEVYGSCIEQFGGELGEEIEEGKGSTVWFTLPIADESGAEM